MARGALRPIPPPFPAREGGEGSRIRCGGEPLRRDGGFSHRTADFYRCAPYLLASRMRSADMGCQLPPVSTTHAREAARVVDGETRGVRGVGWVVGAGARRAGRPGSRRGRKAPGRLPGRLLLWASAPPRLTSCRQCGKMLHEGSHRRRSQRRPSSMVRQKPGRFRNDRALLYPGHHPRDHRRIKAPNATKPRYFVALGKGQLKRLRCSPSPTAAFKVEIEASTKKRFCSVHSSELHS